MMTESISHDRLLHEIDRLVKEIAAAKGARSPKVTAQTELLGGGLPLDSLDLATLVLELEQVTGFDAFKAGVVNFRTAGDLARLYQR
jgi:acyl carrier protein